MENNEIYEYASFGDIPVDYLMHHGIKGQKWGVRRYQNKDGSLTKAGRKRYAKLEAEMEKLGGKKTDDDDVAKPKKARDMTDDELRSAVNRLQLEEQYNRLYNQLHPQKVKSGKKYVETLVSAGVTGLAEGGKSLIRDALIKKGKEALGIKDEKPKSAYEKLKEQYDLDKLKQDYKKLKNGDDDDYAKLKKQYDLDKLKQDYEKLKKGDDGDDSDWKKIVKELNNMSDEAKKELKDAAQIQENINKLKGKSKK